jgi:predicted O-linked N-acetylglucosamine transferase (SPINDLY family)
MDFRLTDGLADPGDQDRFYTEKLHRLPGCFLCYKPPINSPPVTEPPVLKNGYITFGSFNNLPKVSEDTVSLWSDILKAVPDSRLLIKTKPFNDSDIIRRYENLFINNGIEKNRLLFKGYATSLERHLAGYGDMDIGLDTFPYNGTTTTCEALWMGVPAITLTGEKHAGRVGMSLLFCIGLSGMVAQNREGYLACASFLAGDVKQLSKLRKGLRPALARSPLCDGKTFTQTLENAYRDMWRRKAQEKRQP